MCKGVVEFFESITINNLIIFYHLKFVFGWSFFFLFLFFNIFFLFIFFFLFGDFFAFVFNKFDHGVQVSSAVVVHHSGTFAFWKVFKGWESLYFYAIEFVLGGIRLGNNDGIVIFEVFTEFVPSWGQLFAVSAPWGIKFDKNSLCWVLGNAFKVFTNNDSNWGGVIFWDFFTHQVSDNTSVQNSGNKSRKSFFSQIFSWWLVFLHGFAHFDNSDIWAFFFFQTKEFQDSAVIGFVAIDVNVQDFSSVGFGRGGESFQVIVEVRGGFGGEEKDVFFDVTSEDFWGGFVGEFGNIS